jgi:hypothetical protein
MQKCKYLDDLNIPIDKYGTNFMPDDDWRAEPWAKEREEYGFDNRETWNLDRIFIEWIYTRVMMYKEYSVVDMNYHKIKYKDTEITQGEAIDKILELAKEILLDVDNGEMFYDNSREICDIWKEVLPCMWW